jgi:AcrR family transcriptional regulator
MSSAYVAFTTRGYTTTKMADVASAAGVAVDTIYATVGTKASVIAAPHRIHCM